MKTYTIQQGNHYADGLNFKTHSGKTDLMFSAVFNENCIYEIPGEDNFDINKLFGLTWGLFNDNNSFRIGWNCMDKNGAIQLFAYIHDRGAIKYQYLGQVLAGNNCSFSIYFNRSANSIEIASSVAENIIIGFIFSGIPKYGYYNWPYFGGNQSAPHTMNIELSY